MPRISESSFTECECILASDDGVKLGNQNFVPDRTKGFMKFHMAKAFPNVTKFGTGMLASVVARSAASLLHQPFDYEHQIAAYHKKEGEVNRVTDRILGSVVAVQFTDTPGWKMNGTRDLAPKIEGVASYAKLAQGMRHIIGEHATGLHRWSVSMEIDYDWPQTGFAIPRGPRKPLQEFASTTPPEFDLAGYDYVPTPEAPEELEATFSKQTNRITGTYKGRRPVLVIGGLDGDVHFKGVALARYGAEEAAGIQSLAASDTGFILPAFGSLFALLEKAASENKV